MKKVIVIVAAVLILGTGIGYYTGYNHGWEHALQKQQESWYVTSQYPDLTELQSESGEEDGVSLAFIKRFSRDNDLPAAEVDFVQWFDGGEAIEAAMEETGCPREEITYGPCAPSLNNGFYIRNRNTTTQALPIMENLPVYLLTHNEQGTFQLTESSLQELTNAFAPGGDDPLSYRPAPYRLLVQQGVVTTIEQVYVP